MTPPQHIAPGRWVRFPGCGKGRGNRAGWCRVITPTLALYGDWSTGLSEIWRDESHRDDAESRRLLRQARERERRFALEQRQRQERAAELAQQLIQAATFATHPYLERKGFPTLKGLVSGGTLLVPMRDAVDYSQITSVQEISQTGEKRFLLGGRTRGCIYRIGVPPQKAKRIALCEGYATGLSIDAALSRLTGPHTVIVCFSAGNLEAVAERVRSGVVCADNDASKTGELAAQRTGLPWIMPPDIGTDFNDLHQQAGLAAVVNALRVAP
jgi:putative DNA primase/helicase